MVVTDTFNNATDQDLSLRSPWKVRAGGDGSGMMVYAATNSIGYHPTNTALNLFYNSGVASFANNQYAQIQLTAGQSATAATNRTDLFVRSTPDANYVAVQIRVYDTTQMDMLLLSNYDGFFTAPFSYTNSPYSIGDVIRLEVVGTVYTVKLNGATVITGDDTGHANPSVSGFPGIGGFNNEPNSALRFDNFEAGDITSGGVSIPRIMSTNGRFIVNNNRFMLS